MSNHLARAIATSSTKEISGACDSPSAPPSHLDFSEIHPQWQEGIIHNCHTHCALSTSLDKTSPSSTMLPALVSKQ